MAKASCDFQKFNLETVEALSPKIRGSPRRAISSALPSRVAQKPCYSFLGVHQQTSGHSEIWYVFDQLAALCVL
jgi:hypothetical protein